MTVKKVYPNIEIKKLECVGHYQKGVGTCLRKLKKREKGLGSHGRLTEAKIDRLQIFFGLAIHQNVGNLKGMKAGVLACFFNVASSKKNNWHYLHCLTGPNSWCKYNNDNANGTQLYKSGTGLPMVIVAKLKQIYADLGKDSELEKCLHGKTQNANESFNTKDLHVIPKKPVIIHRDLNSSNILIKSNLTCCIADFGSAWVFNDGSGNEEAMAQVQYIFLYFNCS